MTVASMHYTIAVAVRELIDSMIWAPEAVEVRKEPIRNEGDPVELCLVTLEGEQRETGSIFAGGRVREYDVRITLLRSGKNQVKSFVFTNPELLAMIRDEIAGATQTTLLGVPEVWDIVFPPLNTFKPGSVASGYDQTSFVVTFRTSEALP